ncbi:unnamed protein product [Dracunculus medinensis]|uniref:lysoplasmalogenase n=1 Tax=Dracunculus medinensis TaxID=318479 RepID=A0A0N4UDP9_DRAME|nr:unnamed protein product [Dracunculus medinensis]
MASPFLAFPYFALVALFYRQSDGFIKKCDNLYEYWKTLPVLILSILCFLVGAGLRGRDRGYTALGLLFGAIGDYLIGRSNDGLIVGAIFFGIGHIFYLVITIVAASFYVIIGWYALLPLILHHTIASILLISYSVLLATCFILSGSLYVYGVMKNFQNNLLRFVGFIFFYASDSALIMYHVGYKFPFAEIIILLTYFVAQYLIVWGTCKTHRLAIISKKMK